MTYWEETRRDLFHLLPLRGMGTRWRRLAVKDSTTSILIPSSSPMQWIFTLADTGPPVNRDL